jgi:4-amino-4-deoxy-L-arabinose transferase-like glycosyltransferase
MPHVGKSARVVVFVLAAAVVVFAIPMGRAPVWEPNNALDSARARHGRTGHWLMPEIRGVPNEGLYKPQLFAWTIALASLPTHRVTEFTAAVPSLVSALAGVAAVIAIGRQLWSMQAGMLAGLVLTTTLNYFVFAQQSLADVMMTGAMVWALYFLLRIRDDDSIRSVVGFYACVGTAMLCKGPPGLAALVAATVAIGLGDGRNGLRRLRPEIGGLVLAVFAIPWVVPYIVGARTAFVHDVVIGEYAHWFVGHNGVLFRVAHMPSVLLFAVPWTLFLPAAVVWWRRDGSDTGRRYALGWTLTLWMLIGLSGAYRARYFLPVYPGLALLIGEFFARATLRVRRHAQMGAIAFVICSLTVLIAMVFPPSVSGEGPVYMPDRVLERVLVAIVALAGIAGVLLTVRRDTLIGLGSVIAAVMAVILMIEGWTSPTRRAHYYDVPGLGVAAAAHVPRDGTLFAYPDLSLQYDVYVRRQIVEIGSDELHHLLAAPSRDALILSRPRWTAAQASTGATGWHVLESRTIAGVDVVVVGADEATEP